MKLRFKLYSAAGTTALLAAPSSDAFAPAALRQRTIAPRTRAVETARRASLDRDWDNDDFLSSLGGGEEEREEANAKYYKQAESREAMDEWRARKFDEQQGQKPNASAPSPEFFQKMGMTEPPPPGRQPQQPPPQMAQPPTQSPPQQQQFYDANGNPVSMPMIYDQNGDLVPFSPQQPQMQQPSPPQQPAEPQMPPQINPGPAIDEPPLPPKTKGTDSPRPVGFNPDAYTMSNTADVYLAQLKQDTKIRKIARMKGDLETANTVFGDESVSKIKESWKENPYTKEKNHAEARAEIEGTVRLQVQDDPTSANAGVQQISYKQKLAEMQRRRSNVGNGMMPPAAVEQPSVVETKPVADELESKLMEHLTPGTIPDMPPPSASVERPQNEGVQSAAPKAPVAVETATADAGANPMASVEAALERYKNASPEERAGMLAELQEVMIAASNASVEAAMAATPVAETPQVPQSEPPPPMMGFPAEYAVTKPDEEEGPAAEAAMEANPVAEMSAVPQSQPPPPMMGFPAEYAVTKPDEEEGPVVEAAMEANPVAETTAVPQTQPPPPMMGFPAEYAVTKPDEEEAPAPPASNAPAGTYDDLALAASTMDAATVSSLLASGLEMDEETTASAFRAVINAVDRAEALDQPLSGDVPVMLHHIFDADMKHLLTRDQERTNVTCMMPEETGANRIGMNYIFDDSAHKDLPLEEGRRCEGGNCCDKCSRNIFPTFASPAETDFDTYPELTGLTFNELAEVSAGTILQFTRLIERVRRTIAHEYGLPLKTILPLQAYSRKYVAGTTQQGGGGGEGDFVTLHTDEATHDGYHYSCVLYLSTQGDDFEGGNFVFNDPDPNVKKKKAAYMDNPDPSVGAKEAALALLAKEDFDDEDEDEFEYAALGDTIRKTGRIFTPYSPQRGAAVIFSSGWENMHEVETITSGTRYCVPCFFTTCPVPDAAYDQMVQGKPKTNEDIADDWLHLLLAHQKEEAQVSLGRVKELLMKWHYICTPLSEH